MTVWDVSCRRPDHRDHTAVRATLIRTMLIRTMQRDQGIEREGSDMQQFIAEVTYSGLSTEGIRRMMKVEAVDIDAERNLVEEFGWTVISTAIKMRELRRTDPHNQGAPVLKSRMISDITAQELRRLILQGIFVGGLPLISPRSSYCGSPALSFGQPRWPSRCLCTRDARPCHYTRSDSDRPS